MSLPHESTASTAKRAGHGLFIRRRSHDSDEPGIVAHSVRWIDEACAARGLSFEVSTRHGESPVATRAPVKESGQVWAVVTKPLESGDADRPVQRSRAERALRGIRHHVKTLKLNIVELNHALGDEGGLGGSRLVKRRLRAIKSAADSLSRAIGSQPGRITGIWQKMKKRATGKRAPASGPRRRDRLSD